MGLPQSVAHLMPDDYLAWENTQIEKHEYVNGEVFAVFAMVGARREVAPGIPPPATLVHLCTAHMTIAGNVFALLKDHLRAGSCRRGLSRSHAHRSL